MSDIGRKIYIIKMYFVRTISTVFMKLKLRVFKIQYYKDIQFYGQCYLYKAKGSVIVLGKKLNFRSFGNSNLIGINRNCSISTLTQNAKIIIGDSCGFSGTVIGAFDNITLGNNVRCGANTLITDSDWHLDDPRSGEPKSITIEDNVWLGEGVKVLKGVTIGENTVIGAGSVVTKNIPANVIAAGNPCRIIKSIDNE